MSTNDTKGITSTLARLEAADLSRSTGHASGRTATKPVPAVVPERHLYRISDAMSLLSMGRSAIYELIRSGRLKTVTEGRARFVPAKAINDYVNLLMQESGVDHDQASQ